MGSNPESRPAGRPVVLVTGAAKRVGRAIALDLAAHGFDVAVHYRGSRDEALATAEACRQRGARAEAFAADLADEAAACALVPARRGYWPPLVGASYMMVQ